MEFPRSAKIAARGLKPLARRQKATALSGHLVDERLRKLTGHAEIGNQASELEGSVIKRE